MNKKGLSHVDWVMSMGIFIVYVIFMIILLKPGQTEVYQGESLLDIVEINFRGNFEANIEKIPLFINGPSGHKKVNLNFPLKKDCNDCKFKIVRENGDPVSYYNIGLDTLTIEDTEVKAVFWVYGSRYFDYKKSDKSKSIILDSSLETIDLDDPTLDYEYHYGSGEVFTGFSLKNVLGFFNSPDSDCSNYEDIKKGIKYPIDSEFQFFFYKATTPPELIENYQYNCIEPGQNDNVYVKDFATVILNEDLTVQPIIINIRAW